MAKYKSSGIISIKKILQKQGRAYEQAFLNLLTPDEKEAYLKAMPSGWVAIEIGASLSEKAANLIFQKNPEALVEFGRLRAKEQLTGMYKMFISLTSTKDLIDQTPHFWKHMMDTGHLEVETGQGANLARITLREFPNLPKAFRLSIGGFLAGAVEVALHGREVKVRSDFSNSQAVVWDLSWDTE
jgi:hypothetical protein